MAQNTVNYANNPTGPELLDDYLAKEQENNLSSNSGIQRPSYAIAGTPWLDTSTTPWSYKIYDGSRDALIGTLNNSSHTFTVSNINDSNLVHKTGSETITGIKYFSANIGMTNDTNSYRYISFSNSGVTKGTTPTGSKPGAGFRFYDSGTSTIGQFTTWYNTSGNICAAIYAYNPTAGSTDHATFQLTNYSNSTAKINFTTPSGVTNLSLSNATNSTSSDTVALQGWVNNPNTSTNVVHRTGNETIGGIKTFSNNILTTINAVRNVAPSAVKYGGIGIHDNNDNMFASLLGAMDTSKNASVFMRVFNPSTTTTTAGDQALLSLHYNADGSTYVTAPSSDVNGSVITTVNKSKNKNGYFQLGNGLIVQWGTAGDINGYNTITFPKAFTSRNYRVVATQLGSNADLPSMSAVSVTGKTKTTFKVGRRAITEAATVSSIEWIAIGY